MKKNGLADDLNYILNETLPLWEELRKQHIFITGGTGFFGRWLLESFVWINKLLKLNAKLTILTRDIAFFAKKCPDLFKEESLQFYEGDIMDCKFPEGHFNHMIHAAMDGNHLPTSLEMLNTIVQGTKNCLEFAKYCGITNFLFISSGAMYGKQTGVSFIKEKNVSQLDISEGASSYAAGKFIAELMCKLYAKKYRFSIKIARCFAFVGPFLPLNYFAVGNFIHNRLNNESIQIKGDGYARRSYLYTADLCIWLWTILFRGRNLVAYNVGSNEVYSLREIANLIATMMDPKLDVCVENKSFTYTTPKNYMPDITLAKEELNLTPKINLSSALNSTVTWFLSQRKAINS